MFTYDGEEHAPERITDDAMKAAFFCFSAVGAAVVALLLAVAASLPEMPVVLLATVFGVVCLVAAAITWRRAMSGITTLGDASYLKAKEAGDS